MRLSSLLVVSVGLCGLVACGPSKPVLGGVMLDAASNSTLKVVVDPASPGTSLGGAKRTLLTSFMGATGAYSPAAVRKANARYELKYGSWRITEGSGDWAEARTFVWTKVVAGNAQGAWQDAAGKDVVRLEATSTGTGELKLDVRAVDSSVNRVSVAFACDADDHFLGFGAQADGIDHRGHTVPIWTSEPGVGKRMVDDAYSDLWFLEGTRHASSYGLPTWVSNKGYLGVVETDARSVFELCSVRDDAMRIEVWSDHFTLWVFEGNPANALVLATGRVLGRPMRPPAMAFAPWNDALFGTANVRAVAKKLRDNDIPSSVIWTEDFRGGRQQGDAYRLIENWDLDASLYPDAAKLAAELKADGFSWHAYFNTFLVQGNPIFDEAMQGGHFVNDSTGQWYSFSGPTFAPTGLADLSRPETREWVKAHMRKALDLGFTGWMADFGEWLPHDAVLASGESALTAHNRYPHEWAKLNHEVLEERTDGVQRLFFSRSGWLGSNTFTPVVWAGDQRTSFAPDDGLPTVVPLGLNLGLAGVSTFGHDIGGYQSATNPVATKELFFRWASLGALSPVMRTHHGTNPLQGWQWDSDAETMAHYRRWAKLHTQLFPYLDASAAEATANGMPLMRALPLMFPQDSRAWTTNDEYLLGGALLVAPVLTEGATSRTVYLPSGDWVSWDGSSRVSGPGEVTVAAPMGELPMYARVGALVPMLPSTVDTFLPVANETVGLASVRGQRVVRLFVGGQSGFVESDGTGYQVTVTAGTKWYEDNVALADCATPEARGCIDRSGALVVVRMKGQGTLEVPGASLSISSRVAHQVDVEVVPK